MRWPVTPEGRRSSGDQDGPTDDRLDAWLADDYGLAGSLSPLGGEGTNFLLTSSTSRRFVVKLADADATPEAIALEYEAIEAAHAEVARLSMALPGSSRRGRRDCIRTPGCRRRLAAAVGPGMGARHPVAESEPSRPREHSRPWTALGTLDRALAHLEHPTALGRTIGISRGRRAPPARHGTWTGAMPAC